MTAIEVKCKQAKKKKEEKKKRHPSDVLIINIQQFKRE